MNEDGSNKSNKNGSLKKGWFDEFNKLLPLNCKYARVIIGYDCFTSKEIFDAKIQKCQELLDDKNIKDCISEKPIMLIIFPRTSYITSHVEKEDYPNGLIKIIVFNPNGDEWETTDATETICTEAAKNELKVAYSRIAGKFQ